jgi:hypothetical protein
MGHGAWSVEGTFKGLPENGSRCFFNPVGVKRGQTKYDFGRIKKYCIIFGRTQRRLSQNPKKGLNSKFERIQNIDRAPTKSVSGRR